jgi:hypothetical protein
VVIGVGACSSESETSTTNTEQSSSSSTTPISTVNVFSLREKLDPVVGPDKLLSIGLSNGKLLTISGPLTASDATKICEALDAIVYDDPNNAAVQVEISADPDSGDKLLVSRASKSAPCVETE